MKILPPGLTFEQAVRFGHTGRIESGPYLAWLRTLPCHTCGRAAPSDPSHVNGFKGQGTKSPDWFAIPECRSCNRNYDLQPAMVESRIYAAAFYLLRAIFEGRLIWTRPNATPSDADRLYAALLELVECKDLIDSLDLEAAKPKSERVLTEAQWLQERAAYGRRKPLAWDTARQLLVEVAA